MVRPARALGVATELRKSARMTNKGPLRELIEGDARAIVDSGALRIAARCPRGQEYKARGQADVARDEFRLAALLHAIWLVFTADRPLDDDALARLVGLVDDLTAQQAPSEFVEELFDAYADLLAQLGPAQSAHFVAEGLNTPTLRALSLSLSVGAVLLDGRLTEPEATAIALLAEALGFDEDEAASLAAQTAHALSPPR